MNKRHEWQNKPLKINKKEKWALLFKFNKQGNKAEYYLKPISELKGETKETFLNIAQRVNDVPSHWKDRFKVNMYYYSESIMRGESEFYYLFVGNESNLKRVKEEFIKDNSDDTKFEPMLSDIIKPETKRHFEGIIEAYKKKDRSHVLVFNSKGDKVTYYLRPISELTGNKKKDFIKIANKKHKDFGSVWEVEYDVDLYYYQASDEVGYDSDYTHLFLGGKETLERLKNEFIEVNQHNVEFSPELSDIVKPETRRHFEGIIEQMNYDDLVNYITESLEFDPEGQRILDDGKKIADYEVDVVENVTKENILEYFENAYNDPAVKYIKKLKLPKRFTYVWIQFIKLLPRLRGQGKGSEIINNLALSYPPGTLIALSAEEVSSGKTASSLGMLKRFYKQNGFTLVRSQGKVFAFRVV